MTYNKSTYSASGNCVEVGFAGGGVHVRDSKHPDGPVLTFTRSEWDAFIRGVQAGEPQLTLRDGQHH
jgi:hypothetical protein